MKRFPRIFVAALLARLVFSEMPASAAVVKVRLNTGVNAPASPNNTLTAMLNGQTGIIRANFYGSCDGYPADVNNPLQVDLAAGVDYSLEMGPQDVAFNNRPFPCPGGVLNTIGQVEFVYLAWDGPKGYAVEITDNNSPSPPVFQKRSFQYTLTKPHWKVKLIPKQV